MAARDWTLAVDGSQRDDPVVILVDREGEVAWSARADGPAPALVALVREALQDHRDRVGSVLAVRGPGSYIGVRGGLAAALGTAQALGCPLALVGTLEVVAARADPEGQRVLALADAGRGGTFGHQLEPASGRGGQEGWRTTGGAKLLARGAPWPEEWAAERLAIGTPGEGRELPLGIRSISPLRDRKMALAWLVTVGREPIPGYDRVTADYAERVGAR